MLIVDTDVLIDVQRGHGPAVAWFETCEDSIGITGFSAMELVQNARNSKEVELARKLARTFRVVWPTAADCESAFELYAARHRSHGIGLIDSLIACTALGRGSPLGTFNVRHFRAVKGLTLFQPYER